ncbi:MAG: hypothetical protein RMJ05_11370 [Thermomicrobium sp.]|nr:hypothetical protein [Thermomicrobium sp.]MDW8007299.1 hypothetical protein [Thermomicrobium sp.]
MVQLLRDLPVVRSLRESDAAVAGREATRQRSDNTAGAADSELPAVSALVKGLSVIRRTVNVEYVRRSSDTRSP